MLTLVGFRRVPAEIHDASASLLLYYTAGSRQRFDTGGVPPTMFIVFIFDSLTI